MSIGTLKQRGPDPDRNPPAGFCSSNGFCPPNKQKERQQGLECDQWEQLEQKQSYEIIAQFIRTRLTDIAGDKPRCDCSTRRSLTSFILRLTVKMKVRTLEEALQNLQQTPFSYHCCHRGKKQSSTQAFTTLFFFYWSWKLTGSLVLWQSPVTFGAHCVAHR